MTWCRILVTFVLVLISQSHRGAAQVLPFGYPIVELLSPQLILQVQANVPPGVLFPSSGNKAIAALAKALLDEDLVAIQAAVEMGRKELGNRAGVPEVADEYLPMPASARLLTPVEAKRGMTPNFKRLDSLLVWKIGLDPTKMKGPLREPASVLSCMVSMIQGKLDGADKALGIANDTADFLIWAQQQAGAGCYPFPAAKGTSEARAMQVGARFLEKAEAAGLLDKTVRNGWAFEDHGDGGMQFDNAECGLAMFNMYGVSKDNRHLDSALKAADWAASRMLCTNWNYNSFSVHLLAQAYRVTGNEKYRDAALKKALLGVIPGQLTEGPHIGRWMDAHNARPAYHYIMMGAIAELLSVLPQGHPDRATIRKSLTLGLLSRNREMIEHGVMTKDKSIECLLLIRELFKSEIAFLEETKSTEALLTVCKLASEQARAGKLPLAPRAWGMMLVALSEGL